MTTSSANNNNPILSIIILNYNSGVYLKNCIFSLTQSKTIYPFEIIVVDNCSSDSSIEDSKTISSPNIKYLLLDKNLGFAAGNNRGVKIISPSAKFVLFLNPDTTVNPDTIEKSLTFAKNTPKFAAMTCDVILALTGKTQPECHRGFPTPWNSFWHFFGFGLPKLLPKSKLLNGYFMGHLDYSKTQIVDCCVGAFLLLDRKVGDQIGWWNEKYFFYGEDLDFCYHLRKLGHRLLFYPGCQITHFQGVSSGIIKNTNKLSKASRSTKIRSALASTNAMRIFYRENLINDYHPSLHWLIWTGIKLLELKRVFKAKYL